MKQQILLSLIKMFMNVITPEHLKIFADKILDFIELTVEESGTKWDDAIILPLCNMVRNTFNIPDND